MSELNIAFPVRLDGRGTTARQEPDRHVREMIEQLLFTHPGERLNRPDFGGGLLQVVFAPNSPALAAALQFTLQAGLQRWLGDLIEVQQLEVLSEEASVRVQVAYVVRRTGEARQAAIERRITA